MNMTFRLAAFGVVAVFGWSSAAQAALYSASLANDFSLASNTNADTWSYRQAAYTLPIVNRFDYLLPTNTRTAQDLWGVAFSPSPIMRSDATSYYGIGKNTSGGDLTSGATTWPDGAVMMHPDISGDGTNANPSRIVVSWLAPSAMTINASWNFQAMPGLVVGEFPNPGPDGDGVGLEVNTVLGGVGATPVGFAAPTTGTGPIIGSLLGVTVAAGDRLYWSLDNWPTAGGDITMGNITINEVPEPGSALLLGCGSFAVLACARKRRGQLRKVAG